MPLEEILIFLDTHCVKRHCPIPQFTCLSCEDMWTWRPWCGAKLLHRPKCTESDSPGVRFYNLQEFIISKALQITWIQVVCTQAFGNQWYRGRANVASPFFYNLCEPFSLNVQLLCSAITITTRMLLNVCLINFITGCIWNSSNCTYMGSRSSEILWAEY